MICDCVVVCLCVRPADRSLCCCVSVCQAGRQVIDIRAMLNDATKLSHIDDTGDVSITSSSLLSALSLGSPILPMTPTALSQTAQCYHHLASCKDLVSVQQHS